jgi:hypothetical protein
MILMKTMTNAKTSKARNTTVTLDDGRTMELAQADCVGEKPCPGDAHTNGHIDNCMVCLSNRWGFVKAYAPIDVVAECAKGKAVRASDLSRPGDHKAFDAADANPELQLIGATEKRRGSSSHFYVFVTRKA